MNEEPYQNREIREMFNDLKEGQVRIEEQTTKHNGRMTALEKWQYISMGGLSVLTVIVVPILSWALWVLVNINTEVHKAVDEALSAYNIQK